MGSSMSEFIIGLTIGGFAGILAFMTAMYIAKVKLVSKENNEK